MSEKRILLASLLKPINDTRLYEKLGVSLSKIGGTSVHICAYEAPIPAGAPANIHFHPIFRFKRLSIGRASAQLAYYRTLCRIRPQLVVVSTHELLLATMLYKARCGCRIIYDVRENYSLNLRAQHNYSWPLKHLLAGLVQDIEKTAAGSIDHFLLAERSYADELHFLDHRYTLIENKYKGTHDRAQQQTPVAIPATGPLRLLYSGTIAHEYGVWEAITLARQLYTLRQDLQLTIIGYCANAHTWQQLKSACQSEPFIVLIGGDRLVPHSQILEQISDSHIGLLPYRPNPSTFRCIPTKLYEYMAHGLPILIQQNPLWAGIVEGGKAGLSVDFNQLDVQRLYTCILQSSFYTAGIPGDIYWEEEEEKLMAVIKPLLQ